MEVWFCVDDINEDYRFASSSTKAFDILREMFKEDCCYTSKIEEQLTKSFLENQEEFGVIGWGSAKKVEVE